MPITADTPRVQISLIQIDREGRQRRQIETRSLEASIIRNGLIQPIVVTRGLKLMAGERRLTACRNLGFEEIPVTFFEDLDPIESRIIELEENIKREDLPWRDSIAGVAEIHSLFQERDADWTMTETAEAVSLSLSTVSQYLRVQAEVHDPRIMQATTVREAYGILTRRDQRAMGDALQDLLDTTDQVAPLGPSANGESHEQPTSLGGPSTSNNSDRIQPSTYLESIVVEDFLQWAPQYSGPKFNLLHCDFPYGVGLFGGPQGRGAEPTEGYKDTAELYWQLTEALCQSLPRLMSVSGHLMFWHSARPEIQHKTLEVFKRLAPQLHFSRFPLIWFKSDNAGISTDSNTEPRHVYESCLLASQGNRHIVEIRADLYACPTDKKLHPSCKPESMLKHFMTMLVDQNTTLLDPTCGSGAALRAAESLGARNVLGLEINPGFAQVAQQALRQSRQLRAASRTVNRPKALSTETTHVTGR